ncbi:MAG: TonB-dependent receptor [Woeseia sp.]
MKKIVKKLCLLQLAASAGGTFFTSAGAQVTDTAEATDAGGSRAIEEVVVTGSRIRQRNLESVSPILELKAEDFEERGAIRIEHLLNRMPQVTPAANGNSGGRPAGTSQVDLRGLGPDRTLVLVNGRRLPYGSPRHVPSDLNQIPMFLISNVEVLTGGSSAVYGSDALAGVVNVTLLDNFEGLRLRTNLSGYQHHNGSKKVQEVAQVWEAANPGEYVLPDSNVFDGFSREFSIAAGANFNDDRGNVTVYGTYRKIDEVKMSERDYTTCQLGAAPDGVNYVCRPSPVDDPASFVNTGAVGLPSEFRVLDDQFVLRDPLTDRFNDQQYAQHMRPDEQYSLGGFAHYEINEHLIPYFESSFTDVGTFGDFSPTAVLNNGIDPGVGGFNCDNPFFSAQQADFLCTSRGLSTASNYDPVTGAYLGPADIAEGIVINRRTTEHGNRHDELDLTSYRLVSGVRGLLAGPFEYDVAAIYADVSLDRDHHGVSLSRSSLAFNTVIDQRVGPGGTPVDAATFGQPVCAVNADDTPLNDVADCAPIDYFSSNGPSAAAVAFINSQGLTFGTTSLTNVVAAIDGNLEEYGVKSLFADTGVGVAFGAEYRKNELQTKVDLETQEQQIDSPVQGETSVKEWFAEVNVPIVENRPFMSHLSFEGAFRSSDYKGSVSTDTYKLGINWSPVSDIRFRGSFQSAMRAPNVIELFAGQSRSVRLQLAQNADGSFDPCAGPTPFATFEQCARTGVTATDYGTIADNSFVGQLIGGNPDLAPETANTYAFGVVVQPSFMPDLTASIDYFDIEVEDLLGTVNPNITLRECLVTGDPFFCDLIHRGPGGTLFASEDSYISILNVNTGSLTTTGIDFSVTYPVNLESLFNRNFGLVTLNLVGTYLDEYIIKPLPSSTAEQTFDCAGYHGRQCAHPKPEWRHNIQAGWNTPWSNIWVGVTWRYFSAVDFATKSSQPALQGNFVPVQDLGARHFLDLSAAWSAADNLTIRAGANNVMDKDPPLTVETNANLGGLGNTYGGFYDNLGRFLFVTATVDF